MDKEAFIKWHESRMADLNYPPAIVAELRRARGKWLKSVKQLQTLAWTRDRRSKLISTTLSYGLLLNCNKCEELKM